MHRRPAISRTALLVSAAFLAGAATGLVSNLTARHFVRVFGTNAAIAQEIGKANTYRLLALFGDIFELVRSEYVDPVSDKGLIENAIAGMLTGLDAHSDYMSVEAFREAEEEDKGEFSGIGVEIALENGFAKIIGPIDDTPASKMGIRAGDIIIALNGKSVWGLSLDEIIDKMRGPPNTAIMLTIEREGAMHPLVLSVRRKLIHIQVVKWRLQRDNIGYVRLTEFTEPANAVLKQAIKALRRRAGGKLRALVLDLRDNPGGLIDQAVAIARDFIPRGEIVSTRTRDSEGSEWVGAKGTDILGGAPMVVLINSGSASASEIVAGALQDHRRAVLLGTRSFGKGSVQTLIPLPGGTAMLLTTARYYTPSGRSIQGLGIVPDVPVAESPEEVPDFNPEYEAGLNHPLTNVGGTADSNRPRTDLPPIVRTIPSKPPKDFPEIDPDKPDATDFQLQQALMLAKALGEAHRIISP